MKSKVVTTVIANYNYGRYVLSAIQSALDAEVNNFLHKIVVVDDGSTDDSVKKIVDTFSFDSCMFKDGFTNYSNDSLDLIITPNQGASVARNIGMRKYWDTTDYFHILDSDDKISRLKLVKMVEKMTEPEIGVVYADYYISRDMYNKYEYKLPYDPITLNKKCIVHSGSLIKKEYLEKVKLPNGDIYDKKLHGPGSEEFIGCTEDYDLWLRLAKQCMMTHIAEPLTIVSEHGDNQSLKMNTEIFNNNAKHMKERANA